MCITTTSQTCAAIPVLGEEGSPAVGSWREGSQRPVEDSKKGRPGSSCSGKSRGTPKEAQEELRGERERSLLRVRAEPNGWTEECLN